MLLMQHHQDGLRRRLLVIGIPKFTIEPFIDSMVKWENCSGVEWTIKRLKGLKVDLIRSKAGLPVQSWVRKNSKGEFAGTIGSLFRWAQKNDVNFSRCVQAFMAYSYYILPRLTESQKEKFLSSIDPQFKTDNLHESFIQGFKKTVSRTIRRRPVAIPPKPLVTYQGSPGKKAPSLFGRKSIPQCENILQDLEIFNTTGGQNLYTHYHRLFEPLLIGVKKRRDYLNYLRSNSLNLQRRNLQVTRSPVMCGEIHFLQEPGGKLRSVASPLRIFQEVLYPLGQSIYEIVRSLPWDCTFDQSKALPHIQSHLRQGGQVSSVDLSSATDHFPLSLQVEALKGIFFEEDWDHIDLFIEISRGLWKSQIGDLRWTKGQPLGLYPSFGSFTLTHGLLLLHLAGGDYHNQFFVVGDDVVILDENLKQQYIAVLDQMCCPWSEDKSLSSNKLAEFAGKIITPTKVIPQLKWRKLSDDNFLDICRLLGSKSYCLLSRRQKEVFRQVAHLCEPIGLNFSLPGDNLEKMVERTLSFYRPVEVVLGSLMGLRRKLNKLVHTSTENIDFDEIKMLSETFDEKVKEVMSKTIFNRWEFLLSVGIEGFESLPLALGLQPRLPLKEYHPTRMTTLERYERLLNDK